MALVSAALFGASTPRAKLPLGAGVSPWLLAGLLYLGSGLGLLFILLARRAFGLVSTEAPLRRTDLPWLAAVALFGGIVGPVMLMLGLASTPASTASLLLNLEGLATMAIAWLVFRENVDHRLLLGAGAILAGALALSFSGPLDGVGLGGLAITGACLAWGIDNNLTRKLSLADPLQITAVKGVVAGTVNLVLALANGAQLPSATITMAAGLLGLAGYGVSLVLFVLALRHLGTARTGAYFSTAPFLGAVLAIAFLGEPATLPLLIAAILMAGGVWLHLSERHAHDHSHEALEHEHRHTQDDHHQHLHDDGTVGDVTHSHRHRHEPLTHRHPHFPDLHHRHRHS
jgi:drug/metabolite transporter (DMT)-like permease